MAILVVGGKGFIGSHVVQQLLALGELVFMAFRANPKLFHPEMSTMVQGTANLFEAARRHRVKRVVFPSSIAYYGPQWLHGDGQTQLTEESPSLARTIYGTGKRLCEVLAQEYNRHAGMQIVSMRIPDSRALRNTYTWDETS